MDFVFRCYVLFSLFYLWGLFIFMCSYSWWYFEPLLLNFLSRILQSYGSKPRYMFSCSVKPLLHLSFLSHCLQLYGLSFEWDLWCLSKLCLTINFLLQTLHSKLGTVPCHDVSVSWAETTLESKLTKRIFAFLLQLLNVKKKIFIVNIIKIWFPNGFLHRHSFSLNIKIWSNTLLHNYK